MSRRKRNKSTQAPPPPIQPHIVRSQRTQEEFYNYSTPGIGDFLSPFDAFYNGLEILMPLFPAVMDVRYQNYIYLNDSTLALLRAYSRWCYETNVYAKAGLNGLCNYVIGTGYEYAACPRKGEEPAPALLKLVDRFLDKFFEKNQWCYLQWERSAYIGTRRDGDFFLRFHYEQDGIPALEMVWPESIRPVLDSSPDWSFGVLTKPPFLHRPLAFQVAQKGGSTADIVRADLVDNLGGKETVADRMVYFTNHLQPENKRGLSDFFNMRDLLTDCLKLLRAGRQGEMARQAISYVREWVYANVGAVGTIQAGETDYQMPVYSTTSSPRFYNTTSIVGGQVLDVPEGTTFKEGPKGDASALDIILNATLKSCAANWNIPASMLTGEVDSNFAAAIIEESPFIKRCHWDQGVWRQRFARVMKCAIKMAVDWGLLPSNTLTQVDISVECPPLTARDHKQETERHQILYDKGALSLETWSKKEDLDFDKEQQQRQREQSLLPAPAQQQQGPETGEESTTAAAKYQRTAQRPEETE